MTQTTQQQTAVEQEVTWDEWSTVNDKALAFVDMCGIVLRSNRLTVKEPDGAHEPIEVVDPILLAAQREEVRELMMSTLRFLHRNVVGDKLEKRIK